MCRQMLDSAYIPTGLQTFHEYEIYLIDFAKILHSAYSWYE